MGIRLAVRGRVRSLLRLSHSLIENRRLRASIRAPYPIAIPHRRIWYRILGDPRSQAMTSKAKRAHSKSRVVDTVIPRQPGLVRVTHRLMRPFLICARLRRCRMQVVATSLPSISRTLNRLHRVSNGARSRIASLRRRTCPKIRNCRKSRAMASKAWQAPCTARLLLVADLATLHRLVLALFLLRLIRLRRTLSCRRSRWRQAWIAPCSSTPAAMEPTLLTPTIAVSLCRLFFCSSIVWCRAWPARSMAVTA
mmetsp:Transcript_46607/g.114309  ORF Transcript_46607/g.114309 Transcript_46607/m.114309 type:complete len:252 (+) Transcript_46607:62-817(+)